MADDLHKLEAASQTDLYERDYLAWTEVQARALRARTGGENALDYDNLAEEIEDLGKSEYRACESQIENILEHLLKIEFVGPMQTIPHWRKELRQFRRDLNRRLTLTIENRLRPDTAEAFEDVLKGLVTGGMIKSVDDVTGIRAGYDWAEIIDRDWYPEPRYGEA
ncbi:hypothetical protein KOAAANKH_00229 [Brevundimonas sp. NIBR10]|uniref:DUF29 domain-containing protein n=1 Tax=Brevundimonas sp. NIBR10 TaxID=3015997 RepID=UPI0022F1706C|nr:DUF29 domain-containing protein [Brevundimonas sp. NIBR10]WGM45367.1 hypothetical protein KOAAANKH_00229 [Brevundimonas sp. NIBR10]